MIVYALIILPVLLVIRAWVLEQIFKSEKIGTITREQSLRIWFPSTLISWIIVWSGILGDREHNSYFYWCVAALEVAYFMIFNFMLNREFKVSVKQSLKIYIMEWLGILILIVLMFLVFGVSFRILTTL